MIIAQHHRRPWVGSHKGDHIHHLLNGKVVLGCHCRESLQIVADVGWVTEFRHDLNGRFEPTLRIVSYDRLKGPCENVRGYEPVVGAGPPPRDHVGSAVGIHRLNLFGAVWALLGSALDATAAFKTRSVWGPVRHRDDVTSRRPHGGHLIWQQRAPPHGPVPLERQCLGAAGPASLLDGGCRA